MTKITSIIAGRPYVVEVPEVMWHYDPYKISDVEALCRLAEDGSGIALQELGKALANDSPFLCRVAVHLLGTMLERGIDLNGIYPLLVKALARLGEVGCDVRDLMVKMGPGLTNRILETLSREESPDKKETMQVQHLIGILARHGDQSAMELIRQWEPSERSDDRLNAACFFGDIFRFRPDLLTYEMGQAARRLMDDPDPWVAQAAKTARWHYSVTKNKKVPVVKLEMLESDDPATLLAVAERLAELDIPIKDAAEPLHRLMLRTDFSADGENIRGLALTALCRIDPAHRSAYIRELVVLEGCVSEYSYNALLGAVDKGLLGEWLQSPNSGLCTAALRLIEEGCNCLLALSFMPELWSRLTGPDGDLRVLTVRALFSNAEWLARLPLIWPEKQMEINRSHVEKWKQLMRDTLPVLEKVKRKPPAIRTLLLHLKKAIASLDEPMPDDSDDSEE